MNNQATVLIGPPTEKPPADALLAGHQLGDFEVVSVLGAGGFGIVYAAWDKSLEREVALKEFFPANLCTRDERGQIKVRNDTAAQGFQAGLRSFVNEARLLAQFDHPALVKVYRFWEDHGTAYMVMPLYRGVTLSNWCKNQSIQKTEERIQSIVLPLTQALDTLHQRQCIHRDISPDNILIQHESGLPVLLDFGAARRAMGIVGQAFTVILKASYAPIEQYAEDASLTQGPWTDVYSLAAVLHFVLTGKNPPLSVARMVNDHYQPLLEQDLPYSNRLRAAVDKGLALRPEQRIASMADFQTALAEPLCNIDALLEEPPTSICETAPHLATRPQVQKPRRMLGVSAMLSVCLAGGLMVLNIEKNAPAIETVSKAENTAQPSSSNIEPGFEQAMRSASGELQIQATKQTLRIGEDLLKFTVTSPVDGHLAVYVKSSDGHLLQLLPNRRIPALQVKANTPVELPPAQETMQAAGPAGENHFLVIVTERPRNYDLLQLGDYYGFGLVAPLKLPPSGLLGQSPCQNKVNCSDQAWVGQFQVSEVN